MAAYTQTRTVRTFTYDESGKLVESTEQTGCAPRIITSYGYDLMGNRSTELVKDCAGRVLVDIRYTYNDSNQLVEKAERSGCYTERTCYCYDKDGNLVSVFKVFIVK